MFAYLIVIVLIGHDVLGSILGDTNDVGSDTFRSFSSSHASSYAISSNLTEFFNENVRIFYTDLKLCIE